MANKPALEIKQNHKSGQLIHKKAEEEEEDGSKVQMGQLENKQPNSRLVLNYITLNINGLQLQLKTPSRYI